MGAFSFLLRVKPGSIIHQVRYVSGDDQTVGCYFLTFKAQICNNVTQSLSLSDPNISEGIQPSKYNNHPVSQSWFLLNGSAISGCTFVCDLNINITMKNNPDVGDWKSYEWPDWRVGASLCGPSRTFQILKIQNAKLHLYLWIQPSLRPLRRQICISLLGANFSPFLDLDPVLSTFSIILIDSG